MKILAYFGSFFCALPCVALALWVRLVGHVVIQHNPFVLFWEFLEAFGRGLPVAVLVLLGMIVLGAFPLGRLVGALVFLLLNAAALWTILRSPAAPKEFAEYLFYAPSLVSMVLAGLLVAGHFSKGAEPAEGERAPADETPDAPA